MHASPCICAAILLGVFLTCIPPLKGQDLKVAAFNIQIFGKTKASKDNVMEILRKIIIRYDVVLVQEIREKDMTAITELMRRIANPPISSTESVSMKYVISARLGRSTSKEQYAFIYNVKRLKKISTYQYEDKHDYFEREPFCAIFQAAGEGLFKFGIIGIHVKPSDAVNEISNLTLVYDNLVAKYEIKDVVIMGDFNADCDYVRQSDWPSVSLRSNRTFTWLLDDSYDTTVKASNCAYDRFVIAGRAMKDAIVPNSTSVFRFDTEYGLSEKTIPKAEDISDHYPIEFKIKKEVINSGSSANGIHLSALWYIAALIVLGPFNNAT